MTDIRHRANAPIISILSVWSYQIVSAYTNWRDDRAAKREQQHNERLRFDAKIAMTNGHYMHCGGSCLSCEKQLRDVTL